MLSLLQRCAGFNPHRRGYRYAHNLWERYVRPQEPLRGASRRAIYTRYTKFFNTGNGLENILVLTTAAGSPSNPLSCPIHNAVSHKDFHSR